MLQRVAGGKVRVKGGAHKDSKDGFPQWLRETQLGSAALPGGGFAVCGASCSPWGLWQMQS